MTDRDLIKTKVTVVESGCWEWSGRLGTHGYGVTGNHRLAHRVAYEAFKGSIGFMKIVMHKCDNRKCCNPDHLIEGFHSDNTRDAYDKGRMYNAPTKLSDEDVVTIRRLLTEGVNQYEIAHRFGVRQSYISRINTGNRRNTPRERK